ncbi:MAG: hypothetical protein EP328_07405 [Gammaproteobacteria bacterium]|nr:MAG: hypothetical protein EP328_07405 [Gammaproteobacteria bacterium]
MKFPTVTVVLVSAALLVVLWEQTQEKPGPVEASRFSDLRANPAERSVAMDWVVQQIPQLCEDRLDEGYNGQAASECVEEAQARTSACRREIYDRFPSIIASDTVFRDLTLTAMECLVPHPSLVRP